ncbi:MAG: hypothetical protein MJ200_05365 [Mycoplasmoidaceae bacterium]|nr:hypothetical protein [Mycoplasmoidaceae bacterium]
MGNEIKYLETKQGKYPYAFTLNVMELIQNKYESLNNWKNVMEPDDGTEPSISAVIFFFTEAINEGIDMENERLGEDRKFITAKHAGRIISELGLNESAQKIKEVVIDSNKADTESLDDESKNVITTQDQ